MFFAIKIHRIAKFSFFKAMKGIVCCIMFFMRHTKKCGWYQRQCAISRVFNVIDRLIEKIIIEWKLHRHEMELCCFWRLFWIINMRELMSFNESVVLLEHLARVNSVLQLLLYWIILKINDPFRVFYARVLTIIEYEMLF